MMVSPWAMARRIRRHSHQVDGFRIGKKIRLSGNVTHCSIRYGNRRRRKPAWRQRNSRLRSGDTTSARRLVEQGRAMRPIRHADGHGFKHAHQRDDVRTIC